MKHVHITLVYAPWEKPKPKPLKRKRYPRCRFPRGTPQIEKYWRKGQITDKQYEAACRLASEHSKLKDGYSKSSFNERIDTVKEASLDEQIDARLAFNELMSSIPDEFRRYVDCVVLEGRSLNTLQGNDGGANHQRYLKRLGKGLSALACINRHEI